MKPRVLSLIAAAGLAAWYLQPSAVLSHETAKTTVTFEREVSRILSRKCLSCHAEKTLAFPLTTYEETRPWARAIEEEILSRHMPPWRAAPGYGLFANDGSLTTRELQLLVAWIEGNGPKDANQKIIANIEQLETSEKDTLRLDTARWELGKPAWTGELRAGVVQTGLGDHVRTTLLETGFTEPRWAGGVEIKPADRRVVRAMFLTLEGTGQWLGSWTPWHGSAQLPDRTAFRLPAGARIVVESHYRSGSEPVEDRAQVGLYFADAPSRCASDLTLRAAGDGEGRLRATATLTEDSRVLALRPMIAEGIHAFEVRARMPDGATQILLFVKDVLYEWPTPYIFNAPVALPRGTTLVTTAHFKPAGGAAAAPAFQVVVSRDAEGSCGAVAG